MQYNTLYTYVHYIPTYLTTSTTTYARVYDACRFVFVRARRQATRTLAGNHTPVRQYTDFNFRFRELEDENGALQAEYERLRGSKGNCSATLPANVGEAEMVAEAKLLRQHKGRLEARMQILEDHNRQLEAQLQRLRQLLDEVSVWMAISSLGRRAVSFIRIFCIAYCFL